MLFQEWVDGFVWPQIESRLCGLVVGCVLCRNAQPVGYVFLQTVHAVVGGDGAHIEAQLAALTVAGEHFLAPVANDVGTQVGIRF